MMLHFPTIYDIQYNNHFIIYTIIPPLFLAWYTYLNKIARDRGCISFKYNRLIIKTRQNCVNGIPTILSFHRTC